MRPIIIFTDGACSGNPGPGGWGAFLKSGKFERELYGGEKHTTNNRMELMAAIEALTVLDRCCSIELTTDSTYVKNGVTSWLQHWKINGWKTASKRPVKNKDLWLRLDEQLIRHQIDWRWVKGHSGNPGNERADNLANIGMRKAMERHSG